MTMTNARDNHGSEIAVIGIAGRFPDAPHIRQYWSNLKNGVDSIRTLTDEELLSSGERPEALKHPRYVKKASVIEGSDLFDASFFSYSPQEALLIDPQQRLFLECAWHAFEDAGCDPFREKRPIGVFAGLRRNTYFLNRLAKHYPLDTTNERVPQIIFANDADYLATRVSYQLNLTGPSYTLQSACSTALVAIHTACQHLLHYDCDIALAGASAVNVPENIGYLHSPLGSLSASGQCRAFDADADGTVFGNGVGAVVLKRLEDAIREGDHIYAVIKGSAVNNDGGGKAGFTAPSIEGQERVLLAAYANAGVNPRDVGFIECHGTGTSLGDPIEVAALTKAFRRHTRDKQFCILGSVKTNIGHLDCAAGIAGFIKTVFCLQSGEIPPTIHFDRPNPKIDFSGSPFWVNKVLLPWKGHAPRRAGVSAFGVGGTNAHVVLEQAPSPSTPPSQRNFQLITWSAKTDTAFEAKKRLLARDMETVSSLPDAAFTLATGRALFEHRGFTVVSSAADATRHLTETDAPHVLCGVESRSSRSVVFLFPGAASISPHLFELYGDEPVFRRHVDECFSILKAHLDERALQSLIDTKVPHDAGPFKSSTYILPVLFTYEYALARWWMSLGVQPQAMIGHSFGEYAAAALSGVLSLTDALSLAALRGKLFERVRGGDMLSVGLSAEEVTPLLDQRLSVASVNSPRQCVVSGPKEAIDGLSRRLKDKAEMTRLDLGYAGHHALIEPILSDFRVHVSRLNFEAPRIPYISCVTGEWIRHEDVANPDYWVSHLRQPVLFSRGSERLMENKDHLFVEIGPGRALSGFLKDHSSSFPEVTVFDTQKRKDDTLTAQAYLLTVFGKIWISGGHIDWKKHYEGESRLRVPLHVYPFDSTRHWPDAVVSDNERTPSPSQVPARAPRRSLSTYAPPRSGLEKRIARLWEDELGIEKVGIHDDFFDLGGTSLIALALLTKLSLIGHHNVNLHALLEKPTVASFALLLEETHQNDGPVIFLKKGDPAIPPFFFIHPAGGSVFVYRDLASLITGPRPVIGIHSVAMNGRQEFPNVEEMGRHYLSLIEKICSEGPYFLLGASMGGSIVFEIARLILEKKKKIALLAMADSPGPGELPFILRGDLERTVYLFAQLFEVPEERITPLSQEDRILLLWNVGRKSHFLPKDMTLADFSFYYSLFQRHGDIHAQYKPVTYPGDVIYFRAREWNFVRPVQAEEAWVKWVSGRFDFYSVPGDHRTMLEKPHVHEMASVLNKALKENP